MKTRKKRGGWGKQQENTVRRRHNLLAYTSNSKKKSNEARSALQQYLNHSHEEEKQNMITPTMTLNAIMPVKVPGTLTDYITDIHVKCERLIETLIQQNMDNKKKFNEELRLSKKETFLANRSAARVQQAAHIASLSRLSTPTDPAVQAELDKWNHEVIKRGLEQKKNEEEAARIFKNTSSIEREEARLRYVLTKQLAEHIEKRDYIIQRYHQIQSNSYRMGAYYSKKNADLASIVTEARALIIKDIPLLKGVSYVDRALPSIMEDIMELLITASGDYVKSVKGTPLEIAKARLEHTENQLKQLSHIRNHFDILSREYPQLRPELAKNPLLSKSNYDKIVDQFTSDLQEVKKLEK
jgi:hypothetical protein